MTQQEATQQLRQQAEAVRDVTDKALRTWNELTTATATLAFELAEQGLRYSQVIRSQSEQAFQQGFSAYRQEYQDALTTWQAYLRGVSEIGSRNS